MKLAVVGAGWAGCAAAVEAVRRGHQVTLYEASRTPGGRARTALPAGADAHDSLTQSPLDNGQHILIGASTETLALLAAVGISESAALLRLPLTLIFADGRGLRLPRLPAPLDALVGIARADGWTMRDRWSLLRTSLSWRAHGFECPPDMSVAALCDSLTPALMSGLIDPLCVSALNTPADQASGQVFLRVLRDSLFAPGRGSDLLLPRQDLGALLPEPACRWLQAHGASLRQGHRVQALQQDGKAWRLDGVAFDQVILACAPWDSQRLVQASGAPAADWLARTNALQHEAITTVYAQAPGARLAEPMLALRSDARSPAQFVFDRGLLTGQTGLLAFVVSASHGDRETLTQAVIAQGRRELVLPALCAVQTITERRATFACTPGLVRPAARIAPGLLACGDYIEGPYPATLEGAVRSGLAAARMP